LGSSQTWYDILDCGLNNTDVLQDRLAEVPLKLPLRFGDYAPPTVCSLRVPLGDGVYELEKGFSDRRLRNGDVVKLRLGGILTGSTSQKLVGDANVW